MRHRGQAFAEHMLGHGYYNKHSHAQGAANTYGLPLLERAVDRIELDYVPGVFRVADYGSAQDHNSLLPIKTTLSRLNSRTTNLTANRVQSVEVFHTDLPGNDWSTLFNTVFSSPDSYLIGQSNVFVYASATSIYEQIFPRDYIMVGYSAIAVHWLSRKPCAIPGHIWSVRTEGEAERKWRQRAQADWSAFLESRATEMIPSGGLVVVGSGADSNRNSGAESLMDLANQILRRIGQEGILTEDELQGLSIPTYYRTRAEWEEPFNNILLNSELKLIDYAEAVLPDVYVQDTRIPKTRLDSRRLMPVSSALPTSHACLQL